MWVLLILLLILMYINPPITMNVWNKTIMICIIILLTYKHVLLGLIATGMFIYKLTYREAFVQKKQKKTKKERLGLDESLRPKESNTLLKN